MSEEPKVEQEKMVDQTGTTIDSSHKHVEGTIVESGVVIEKNPMIGTEKSSRAIIWIILAVLVIFTVVYIPLFIMGALCGLAVEVQRVNMYEKLGKKYSIDWIKVLATGVAGPISIAAYLVKYGLTTRPKLNEFRKYQ